ncbi:MAG: DUF1572 family protein [Rhodothermia bacterium]|nr:DUF1572 family protein [Rhodothermia bacterium]
MHKIRSCLALVEESEIWLRPHPNANALGNQLMHLVGNIRQYVLSAMAGEPDFRNRSGEFSATEGASKQQLLNALEETVEAAVNYMQGVDEPALQKLTYVQGKDHSGMEILIHVTQHFSYHTGQIVFWTKQLRGVDMAFYRGLTLDERVNSGT